MTLVYQSTRDENNKVTASQAILQGLATDGGLYMPKSWPSVSRERIRQIEVKALRKLRHPSRRKKLEDFKSF